MSDRQRRAMVVGAAVTAAVAALLPTAAAEPAASYPTDERGYPGTAAHCDDSQTLVQFGRTSRALVAICISPDGQMEYRGVRLSDSAGLTMAASRSADGRVSATNDGVTYALTPQLLLVSEGDTVLYRDAWLEYRGPSFSSGPATPTGETASAPAPSPEPSSAPEPSASPEPPPGPAPSSSPPPASSPPPTSSPAPTPPTVSTTTVTLTPPDSANSGSS